MTVEWRMLRLADDEYEDSLFDAEVIDPLNRFGRHAIAYVDDVDGKKWQHYSRGSAVELEVSTDGGETFTRRFAGFVVEPRERDNDGADELELEIYSFDHFLRRNNVTRSFEGMTKTEALEEIVTDFTPVKWVPENVDVVNDEALTRSYEGEKLDNVIAEIASKSADEEFGVNDDLEFFFRPRETTHAPRDIDNTQWLAYDIPEAGKEAVNEVQLFYGRDGEEGSVIVTDGNDKLALQESIGTDGPVVLREEVTREEIDNDSDAKEKAEEILSDREATLTGTVTSYGLFDAVPGQTINIEIVPRDLEGEFRIAELEYRWGSDETVITIVEKRGAQDETLVRMSDTLKRVEQRAADRDVPASQFEGPLTSRALFRVTAMAITREFGTGRFTPGFGRDALGFGRAEPGIDIETVEMVEEISTRVTNDLLTSVRDAWKGESPPDISQISVGSGATAPSRTDTDLEDREFEVSSFIGDHDTIAQFIASTRPQQDVTISELGLENDTETLFARATTDGLEVDANAPVDLIVSVEVLDDPEADGVITTTGSAVGRDILADAAPETPTQMAFGADNTSPTVSDTALGDEVDVVDIGEFTDRQNNVVDVTGTTDNETGQALTLREWGMKNASGDLLSRMVYADIILEDQDSLTGTQRYRWENE